MSGQYRCLPAFLLVVFSAATTHAAEKSQYICSSGDLVRRVIIEVGDLATGLPCEVVYWKDKEAPGVRRVLWNARSDAAFCDGKAAGLVDKLATAGWSCEANGEPVQANAGAGAGAAEPATSAAPSTPAAPSAAAALSTTVPAVEPQPVQPQPTVGQSQTANLNSSTTLGTTAQTAPAPAPAPAIAPSATGSTEAADAATTGAAGSDDLRTAALTPAPSTTAGAGASSTQLQIVIEANLASLNQSVDGDFQAQIGDFGDLNNDGIDDAVVFFNYESSTADFTQFVAAYLFNGENYHLAATKPVGGTDLAVRRVEVEDIVNGAIQLRLLLNDASQTEDRRAAMIFKDGQLVETE